MPDWASGFDVRDPRRMQFRRQGLAGYRPHPGPAPARPARGHSSLRRTLLSQRTSFPTSLPGSSSPGLQSTRHDQQQPIEVSFIVPDSPITKGLARLDYDQGGTLQQQRRPPARYGNSLGTGSPNRKAQRQKRRTSISSLCGRTTTATAPRSLRRRSGTMIRPCLILRYLDLVTRGLLWSCGKLNDDYLKPVARK